MQQLRGMQNSTVLRQLISACVDEERTLRHERKFVSAEGAETFTRMASERAQFASELKRLGDTSRSNPGASWAEFLREAGRSLWVSAAGRNNGDAVRSCRHSRARTEGRYDAAMQRPWSDETRNVLVEQRRRIHEETDELSRLQF
jgi:hypothetical protein